MAFPGGVLVMKALRRVMMTLFVDIGIKAASSENLAKRLKFVPTKRLELPDLGPVRRVRIRRSATSVSA
jgi:hypothetical protein